jgi:hypothetical protein
LAPCWHCRKCEKRCSSCKKRERLGLDIAGLALHHGWRAAGHRGEGIEMGETRLKAGDLVRRDPEDVWRILSIPDGYDRHSDRAECRCERPSLGWLQVDGSRAEPWAKNGRIEKFVICDLAPLDSSVLD